MVTQKNRFLLLAIFLFLVEPYSGGAVELEYEVKAEYLERFTRFIDWPIDSPAGNYGSAFRLCVIGENPFGSYLQEMTGEVKFKGRRGELKFLEHADRAADCDLLFIAKSESQRLEEILEITRNHPILTVSDTPGFAEQGVAINFYSEASKVRFEINSEAIKRSRLHISSRLLALARPVSEATR